MSEELKFVLTLVGLGVIALIAAGLIVQALLRLSERHNKDE